MASNAQKGSRYKARTKKWLEARGYQVGHLEVRRMLFRRGQISHVVTYDQFGADLLAVNDRSVLFVQVKGGATCRTGTFPEARRKFASFTFPPWVRRVVIAWPLRARRPRIVECRGDVDGETQDHTQTQHRAEEETAARGAPAGDGRPAHSAAQ